MAIGNPFRLSHSVSVGILSAKGRTHEQLGLGDPSGYYDFLQTDASINPGNSGGPLIDVQGNVVGINTAIRAQANSIGFAVPIDMVKELLPRLVKDGRVIRSAVGVTVTPLHTEDLARLGRQGGHQAARGRLGTSCSAGGTRGQGGTCAPTTVIVEFEGDPIPRPRKAAVEGQLSRGGADRDPEGGARNAPFRPEGGSR